MTAIPPPTDNLASRIYKTFEARSEQPRPHLGASQLGHHCPRYLWLSFRWAISESFTGRILRLFRRGHDEERYFVDDLRAAGVDVSEIDPSTGKQYRVNFSAHVSGSTDGVALSGIPEAPRTPHLLEFKTHSKKSFDELEKKGVQQSKPMHFIQMQVYMHGTGLTRAVYGAVCKDDDRLYFERVRYDEAVAELYINRGISITKANHMVEPVAGASPDWYQCKFCAAYSFCYEKQLTTNVNCRTCAHSTATDSGWYCVRWDGDIPIDAQYTGCPSHTLHPDLVPYKLVSSSEDGFSAGYEIDGQVVMNGEAGVSSPDIIARG